MQRILDSRNLSCLFQVPNSCSAADAFKVLDRIIQAARIAHMDEVLHVLSFTILLEIREKGSRVLLCSNI